MSVQYIERYELQNRGAVDPAPSSEVKGLLVGTRAALEFTEGQSAYGEDYVSIFPAVYNGNRAWLKQAEWSPAYGYSASGTSEVILSFNEGVKIFLERGVFEFPVPE